MYIRATLAICTLSFQAHVPVPISAQAPVTNVSEAMQLLRTDQESLISGLTHSKLNVNFAGGNAPGMTLLHYAAMVSMGEGMEKLYVCSCTCLCVFVYM